MNRMSSALVLGDPAMAVNPMRRAVLGLLIGVVIGLLAVVAFGVYGWIVPGGATAWRKPGAVIVEKESGTQFVFVGGKLHPTLNMASAMIINGPSSRVELVSRNSLKDVPRGAPVGIPGAPQVLPAQPSDVARGPWLLCLPAPVGAAPKRAVGINFDPQAPAAVLPPDRFVLVTDDRTDYLIWRNHKHKITDRRIPVGLGVPNAVPVPAPQHWLRLLPDGPGLAIPAIPGAGESGASVNGRATSVGQLFRQDTVNGEQLFVLRRDGLAPLNRTMFQLLRAKGGADPMDLDVADVAAAPRSADRSLSEAFTDLSAAKWESGRGFVLCQRQAPAGTEAFASEVVLTTPEHGAITADGRATVRLRPGTGVVVNPVPRPAQAPQPHLIADLGVRYRLPDKNAMAALRLSDADVVPFPAGLLELVPAGPALSREMIHLEREG